MFDIQNDDLRVTLLHPEADRDRLGVRYCAGGYVFQVEDAAHGPLLSGPTYPDSFNWFDGQGIPDSFNHAPLRSHRNPGVQALILGIGLCDTDARKVVSFDDWSVQTDATSASFVCTHEWDEYRVELRRSVHLTGRVLRSDTEIINHSVPHLPVTWFPHPFFPLTDGPSIAALAEPVVLSGGGDYVVGDDGYLQRVIPESKQAISLTGDGTVPFSYLYRHPLIGLVAVRHSFSTRHGLVWGNDRTYSIEPFLDTSVGRGGGRLEFTAEYHF